MANRSVFTAANNYNIDSFQTLSDLPPEKYADAQTLQTLMATPNKTSAQITQMVSLMSELANYYISPELFNKITDCIYNLESNHVNIYNDFIANADAQLSKFSDKGNYNNGTTYQQWNTVNYNYETYMSLQDSNLNHQPDISSTWWRKIAQRGMQGLAGLNLVMTGVYNNSTTYSANQCVSYNGGIYYALQSTVGNAPTNITYWGLFQANMSPVIQSAQPSGVSNGQIWIQTY